MNGQEVNNMCDSMILFARRDIQDTCVFLDENLLSRLQFNMDS